MLLMRKEVEIIEMAARDRRRDRVVRGWEGEAARG